MTTEDAVQSYYDAWINRGGDMANVPLADDFVFVGPVGSFESADEFRTMAAQFGPIVQHFSVRHQFTDGDLVCSIVRWNLPEVSGTTDAAELLTAKDGVLVRAEVIYDGEDIRKAIVNGGV